MWATPAEIRKMWANFDWRFWRDEGKREIPEDEDLDPHYREMLKYPDAPNSWYIVVLIASIITALVLIYKTDSTLPWYVHHVDGPLSPPYCPMLILSYLVYFRWGFIIACLLSVISILFFGSLYAITGLQFIIQPFVSHLSSSFNFPSQLF